MSGNQWWGYSDEYAKLKSMRHEEQLTRDQLDKIQQAIHAIEQMQAQQQSANKLYPPAKPIQTPQKPKLILSEWLASEVKVEDAGDAALRVIFRDKLQAMAKRMEGHGIQGVTLSAIPVK